MQPIKDFNPIVTAQLASGVGLETPKNALLTDSSLFTLFNQPNMLVSYQASVKI